MKLAAKTREQVVAEAHQQYRDAMVAAPAADVRNAGAIGELDALQWFEFRGQPFLAGPTPYLDGVALLACQVRLQELDGKSDPESLAAYEALLTDAVKRFRRLARPARLRDRIRWLARNPFAGATESEIGWLVGFFSTCRMIARVRHVKRS